MTVFLALAKRVIFDKANDICRASSAADTSLATQAMRFIAPSVRNDKLSAQKRALITTNLAQLDTIDESQTDARSFAQLIAMLKTWIRQEESLSTEHGYGRGETETGLENLEALLEAIFDKLSEVKLIDIPIDTDPLAIVRHSFAEYYIGTITLLRDPSLIGRATMSPSISSRISFAKEQQALVAETLQQCLRHMNLLNTVKSHPDYLINTKEIILFILKSLKEKNEALRLTHSKGMLPGVSAIIQVDSGILDRCLQTAEAEIIGPEAHHRQILAFDDLEDSADAEGFGFSGRRYDPRALQTLVTGSAASLSAAPSSEALSPATLESKAAIEAERTATSVQALTGGKARKAKADTVGSTAAAAAASSRL